VKDACSVIGGMGPKIFPDLRGAVLLLSSSRESLEVPVTWLECGLSPGSHGPQDCWALRTGRLHAVASGDRTAECRHASCAHSYFCLPLLAHGEPIGIVHFQMIDAGDPAEAILLLANMFAAQIGLSVISRFEIP
jgi:GAF domain-containing protein